MPIAPKAMLLSGAAVLGASAYMLGFASSRCFEPFDLSDDVDEVLCLSCERAAHGLGRPGHARLRPHLHVGLREVGQGRHGPGRGAEARAGTGTGIGTGALFRKDVGLQEMAGWRSP